MAQGKFKKSSQVVEKKQKNKKCAPFTRRSNAPIQKNKNKFTESQKIKGTITKSVNKSFENELRSRASAGHINLSKAQQAVAMHHQLQPNTRQDTTSEINKIK